MSQAIQGRQGAMSTYFEHGASKLRALCLSSAFAQKTEEIVRHFRTLIFPWGERPLEETPRFLSDVGDDHTPYEFSLAIGGNQPELRILLEAQGEPPSLESNWQAGKVLSARIARDYGADLSRLRLIEDLFEPKDPSALFAVWHAVSFWPNRAPEFKIYFNLQAQGKGHASVLLEEALSRLGLDYAYGILAKTAGYRGPYLDELKYFSLDLASHKEARVKLYVRHHNATVADLERALSATQSAPTGALGDFCQKLLGSEGPFSARPFASCLAFVEGAPAPKGTLYAPLAYYLRDDLVAHHRLCAYLKEQGLPVEEYSRPLEAFASRPLEDGVGLHSYASYKREKGRPKVTIYLAPEAYRVYEPGSLAKKIEAPWQPSPEELCAYYEQAGAGEHPLFHRMHRESPDLGRLWLLMANGREGIGNPFVGWLSSLISRIQEGPIRAILAKQLNDELGDGDFSRSHRVLLDRLIEALDPFRPKGNPETLLAPGRILKEELEALYTRPDPYEAIGASIVVEIFGKQVDQQLGKVFRRQKSILPDTFTWVTLHETLEEEHASESLDLARLAPKDKQEAILKGASDLAAISWRYLDNLYQVCFLSGPSS